MFQQSDDGFERRIFETTWDGGWGIFFCGLCNKTKQENLYSRVWKLENFAKQTKYGSWIEAKIWDLFDMHEKKQNKILYVFDYTCFFSSGPCSLHFVKFFFSDEYLECINQFGESVTFFCTDMDKHSQNTQRYWSRLLGRLLLVILHF